MDSPGAWIGMEPKRKEFSGVHIAFSPAPPAVGLMVLRQAASFFIYLMERKGYR